MLPTEINASKMSSTGQSLITKIIYKGILKCVLVYNCFETLSGYIKKKFQIRLNIFNCTVRIPTNSDIWCLEE